VRCWTGPSFRQKGGLGRCLRWQRQRIHDPPDHRESRRNPLSFRCHLGGSPRNPRGVCRRGCDSCPAPKPEISTSPQMSDRGSRLRFHALPKRPATARHSTRDSRSEMEKNKTQIRKTPWFLQTQPLSRKMEDRKNPRLDGQLPTRRRPMGSNHQGLQGMDHPRMHHDLPK
jgi:hypothetical protein